MNLFKYLFFGLIMIIMLSMAACSFKADLRNPWGSKNKEVRTYKT